MNHRSSSRFERSPKAETRSRSDRWDGDTLICKGCNHTPVRLVDGKRARVSLIDV